jgi:hypothetical protein
VHDPGKVITDLAVMLALGGDCLADAAMRRAEPELFGPVASDPVISRLVSALAADAPRALKAIRGARAAARDRAWRTAGAAAPGAAGGLVTADLDATIVIAHPDKENAAPAWERTRGAHPLRAFADHGPEATGEPLAILLRPGNAGSGTAAGHIEAARLALARLPAGRRALIRADSGGGTHEFTACLHRRRVQYSVGFPVSAAGRTSHWPGGGRTVTRSAAGAHPRASTGPKSPSVGASACSYWPGSALIRAVARHPAMTSCVVLSMVSSAASDSAASSSAAKPDWSTGDRCRAHGKNLAQGRRDRTRADLAAGPAHVPALTYCTTMTTCPSGPSVTVYQMVRPSDGRWRR